MPSLPKHNKPKRTDERPRKPSGERELYTSEWARASKAFRTLNPLCEMCQARGVLTDATPGDLKGVTDHIVRLAAGGARWDVRNLMTLCKPCHDRKNGLEKNGWTCESKGEYGGKYPKDRAKAIQTLIS